MTTHLDSHTTTDVKPEMLSGVIRGIANACVYRKDNMYKEVVAKDQKPKVLCKRSNHLTTCT